MPSTYTTNLGIELPADGELDGVWGDVVNENMDILDRAINGSIALSLTGTSSTLTTSDGALSDGQYKLLVLGGTPSGTHTITIAPNDAQKIYFVRNTTAQSVVFTQGSGGNVTIATGDSAIIYSDGAGAGAAVVNITNDFAMSSVKITGGTIDGTVIGGSSAAAGTFTTVTSGLGAVGTPSITFSGDTNTGIWSPAADTIAFSEGGVEAMRIDSAGNVGIGTTSPASRLNVVGGQIIISASSGTSGLGLQISPLITALPAAQVQGYIGTGDSTVGTAGDLLIAPRTTTTASVRFIVGTTPTERMRIDASGNVYFGNGVNVASPANSFLLATNGSGTDIAGASMTIQAGRGTGAGAGGALAFSTAAAGTTGTTLNAATERMRITSAGNVGIGTSSPAYKLVVSAAGASGIEFGPAYSGTANLIQHYSRSGGVYVDAVNDAAQHRFATSGTERMRIDSSGNVGIGTSTPNTAGGNAGFVSIQTPQDFGLSVFRNSGAPAQMAFLDTSNSAAIGTNGAGSLVFFNAPRTTERMRIVGNGNVGIGTTNPAAKLEVALGAEGEYLRVGGDNATNGRALRFTSSTTGGSNGALHTINASSATGAIALATNSTERLRVDFSGNVGIGQIPNSSQGKLQINQPLGSTIDGALRLTDNATTSFIFNNVSSGLSALWSSGAVAFGTGNGTFTERMRIDSSGNVGIGTTSPAAGSKLSVYSATSSDDDDLIALGFATFTPHASIGTHNQDGNNGGIKFSTKGASTLAERMRIDSAGNVIFGNGDTSATPAATTLRGTNASGTDIAAANMTIQGGRGTGTGAGGALIFSTAAAGTTGTTLNAATERMRISSGGVVSIGTTNGTPASSNVVGVAASVLGYISASRDNTSAEFNRIASDGEVVAFLRAGTKVGSISVTTTATAYNTSSDYRLKEDVQPIFGASDRVRQLNPVNFAWKADGTRTDGFIAHEVQSVAPQAVTGVKDGEEMQSIDHSKLVPLLTAALQEALTEIALLKARLDAANI